MIGSEQAVDVFRSGYGPFARPDDDEVTFGVAADGRIPLVAVGLNVGTGFAAERCFIGGESLVEDALSRLVFLESS